MATGAVIVGVVILVLVVGVVAFDLRSTRRQRARLAAGERSNAPYDPRLSESAERDRARQQINATSETGTNYLL